MSAADEIAKTIAQIKLEEEEQRQQERYQHALRILRTIPSGTADENLTPEQAQAWRDHDYALSWLKTTREETSNDE